MDGWRYGAKQRDTFFLQMAFTGMYPLHVREFAMSNLAHSIVPTLPDTFALGQTTQDDGETSLLPDKKNTSLIAKAKSRKHQIDVFSPKTQPISGDSKSVLSRPSGRLKLDRPGISIGVAHSGNLESGWVTLQADAATTGLHTQGRWQADVEIATNAARVLLAQILPTRVQRKVKEFDCESAAAVVFENVWIDILLHQIENEHSSLCALSMLELAAYRIVNGEVKLIKSVKSSPMPMEMLAVFTLGYRLKNATITIDVCSELDRLTTTNIAVENFGETLPVVKLRSGRALPNGIFRAKYRQIISWSA